MKQIPLKPFRAVTGVRLTRHRNLSGPVAFCARAISPLVRNLDSQGSPDVTKHRRWLRAGIIVVVASFCAFIQIVPVQAQQHKSKLPILGKITGNLHQQAYSGTVQSLDLKQRVLTVDSEQGRDVEFFPIKKDVRVEGLNGKRMQLKALTPGTNVLIYYDEKGGERAIKNIIVLDAAKHTKESNKHAPAT